MLAYEELKGSSGKEIWFRPTRYDARKLFPNNPPKVRVKSASYQLHDISLTGIAVVAKQAIDKAGILPAVTRQAQAIRNEPQMSRNRPPTDNSPP